MTKTPRKQQPITAEHAARAGRLRIPGRQEGR
jgi:hypothetical protein